MLYNYTVTLQPKQAKTHRPRRFVTKARSLSEVLERFSRTVASSYYNIRAIVRKPL